LPIGKLEFGYQYRNLNHKGDFIYERRADFDTDFELVSDFSSQVDLKRSINSAYGQLTGEKGNWQYAAGARVEKMRRDLNLKDRSNTIDSTYVYDFVKIYPSATLGYVIDEKTNIKASYSKRIERTTTFKMNPFPEREHSETLEQGDPLLKPEFVDLFEIGFDKKFKGGNTLFATAYFRNTSNLVNRVNTVYNDTILNRIYSNVGKGTAIGLELGANLKLNPSWSSFIGTNIYNYEIDGQFDGFDLNTSTTVYSVNLNSTYDFWENASFQLALNYLSDRVTAQGEDSRYYSPSLTFNKSFLNNSLTATLQWKNIDMGLFDANEQRITTFRDQSFFTTTNYIYEVDVISLNLSYTFKNGKNKSKFIDSEFGKREF
jgi:outer membrane receptor protein involved in Fe transport